MPEEPLVSVVIPTYERPELVKRAVKSVLNQTYENIEIIVVKGSDDSLRAIEELDSRVSVINQSAEGVSDARSEGINRAEGRFIAFLDDDDEWLPGKIKTQVEQLKNLDEEYGISYGGIEVIKNGEVIERRTRSGRRFLSRKRQGDIYQELLKGNMIPTSTVMVRKECFKNAGLFDTEFNYMEDFDMWLRISKNYKVAKIDQVLSKYYIDAEERLSQDINQRYKAYKKFQDKHGESIRGNLQAHIALQSNLQTYKLQQKTGSKIIKQILSKIRLLGIAVSRI